MSIGRARSMLGSLVVLGVVLSSPVATARTDQDAPSAPAPSSEELIMVEPPPFSEDYWPCSDCHEGEDVNFERREVFEHEEVVFEHDSENRWCLDCHDAFDRDRLHLADGTPVEFTESYKLCGQCHGPKFRDWRAGDHGKRTGSWNGTKHYLLCVHCHDPHSPGFKPIEPMPAPVHPKDVRLP